MGAVLAVGVNLLWCRPGEVGGSEQYLARQLAGLADAAPDIRVRLAVPPGFAAAHADLAARFDVVTAAASVGRRRIARIVAEARTLPTMLGDVDVVHHAGGTLPLSRGSRRPAGGTVLTIHDVQYLQFPQYFSAARRTYLRLRLPPSVRAADVIAVPSEFVKSTVVDAYRIDPGRITVVPHGVDPPAPGVDEPGVDEPGIRRRYGLGDRRIVVYPAFTHPHKGHRFLLDLMAGRWSDPDLVLVLLGGAGAAEADVRAAVAERRLENRVVRPGRVPDADRDGLVAIAEALVFPSEYEGFGAPLLEAMVLGTPVVCSDRAALPEVAGDAALVRPLDLDAWSGALDEIARDRADLVARGRARAARFTTRASGAALAAAYRRAAAR